MSLRSLIGASLALATWTAQPSTLPAASPQVVVSASSAWGSPTDAWAGYSGSLQVWTPVAITGPWTLKFVSTKIGTGGSGFWNANSSYDAATGTVTLTSPSWSTGVAANTAVSVGFNGAGYLGTDTVITGCLLNGVPCVATVKTAADAQTTIANLTATGSVPAPAPVVEPKPTPTPTPVPPTSASLSTLLAVGSSWSGGFSGSVTITNTGSQPLAAGTNGWRVRLKFPDETTARSTFQSGPWNFVVAFASDGTVTLTPQTWAAAVAPGSSATSGFNGVSVAALEKATSVDTTVQFASSVPATVDPAPTPVVDPTPVTVPPSTFALPTGGASGFVFSPYKDTSINLNWNTYVASSKVTGTALPLLQTLPSRTPAVTLAFATGTCGTESWNGVKPDTMASVNVPLFVAQNTNYIIASGGAAGAFHCSSAEGMRTYINRYASRNLIGIDFDIEAGQTEQDILNLVKSVYDVQAEYPNLRFSFTIATLASTNGGATSAPYGDLNIIGYNTIKALAKYPISNYTINLMVMDYGAAGPQNCSIGATGKCDMGQSAIQAAKNLTARYGIANDRIELTAMIGLNDVTDEVFSLADNTTMIKWARANGIAGVHFWSVDRDAPCDLTSASPICSGTNNTAWAYTNQFIKDLGL